MQLLKACGLRSRSHRHLLATGKDYADLLSRRMPRCVGIEPATSAKIADRWSPPWDTPKAAFDNKRNDRASTGEVRGSLRIVPIKATTDNSATVTRYVLDQLDLEAVPGMPRVEDFPRDADMGLVLFSCTTPIRPQSSLGAGPQHRTEGIGRGLPLPLRSSSRPRPKNHSTKL